MNKKHDLPSCLLLEEFIGACRRRWRCGRKPASPTTPLSEAGCDRRVKVCAINGDRKTCAKMANLGLLPGSELELLCKGGGQQCMIKINGGTLSLDALTAATILVTPSDEPVTCSRGE